MKKRIFSKKRITVSVSQELHMLLVERAKLAGVSLSQLASHTLQRKKIVIVPGATEFTSELKQIIKLIKKIDTDKKCIDELKQLMRQLASAYAQLLYGNLPYQDDDFIMENTNCVHDLHWTHVAGGKND